MTKINTKQKNAYVGGKKFGYSRCMNIAFGGALVGSAINNIFDMVNTTSYLNNDSPAAYMNPYGSDGPRIRMGSDLRHSGIMLG